MNQLEDAIILHAPDARLLQKSIKINPSSSETRKIAEHLKTMLSKLDKPWRWWLGLAAPQLGYNYRIIALKYKYLKYKIMVNPEIVIRKWNVPFIARCLSLNGIYCISRYMWVKLQYQDLENHTHEEIVYGPKATIIQQEIDHLDGKLLTDY